METNKTPKLRSCFETTLFWKNRACYNRNTFINTIAI